MPDVPISIVPWFDAKDNPPNERLVKIWTDGGIPWDLDLKVDVLPFDLWCDPSPPDMDGPLGPLTADDLHSAVAACELVADDLQRVSRGQSVNTAIWRERAARLRAALDALGNGGTE